MIRPPPRSTRTDTLFPHTTLFRSERIANELAQTSRLGYEHGLVAGADTAQLDSELSNALAEVTRLQAALRTAKRSLLVLIGRPNSPTDALVIEARIDPPPPIPLADRKCVVKGKNCSLCVDLGGRRPIKIKTKLY